ncbi:MAG: DUF1491 family protein [Pseudomonadota bacterium]
MAPRLSADFWVGAYMARLMGEGIPAHIVAKGDPTAGAVIVKLATMRGKASAWSRATGPEGETIWSALAEDEDETEVDARLSRQRTFDPDLWIVEVEDPRGRAFLEDSPI